MRMVTDLHAFDVGEVTGGYLMLPLDLFVDLAQIFDQLLLLGILAEHGREVFTQGADDVSVDLG